jgi:hypothetical protein
VDLTSTLAPLLKDVAPGMDPVLVTNYLTELDHHLLETEQRILRQREKLELLERSGRPSPAAKGLLRAFEQTRDGYLSERARLRSLLDGQANPEARPR